MWKFKALIQFVFAHLPFGEWINFMAQKARGAYSNEVQTQRLLTQGRNLGMSNSRFPLEGKVALEIGAGWNGIGCFLLYLFGVARVYAYDHQRHMRFTLLQRLIRLAGEQTASLGNAMGLPADRIEARLDKLQSCTDMQSLHERMGVVYCAPGDAANTNLPAASVDYIFSYGVLEHIPRDKLRELFRENQRLLTPEGRAYHNIGLHDHFHNAGLGNGVNFLRYPEWLWGFFCYNAILYHNRLRLPHFLELIEKAGLHVIWQDKELRQVNLDVLRSLKVDAAFAGLSNEDLAASHLYVDLASRPSVG